MGTFAAIEYSPCGMIIISLLKNLRSTTDTCYKLNLSFVLLIAVGFFSITASAQSNADLQQLSNAITNGNIEQKRDALFSIRNLRSAEASAIAIQALSDKEEVVRATAAASVVFLSKDDAVRVLIPLLKDESAFVRREAAFALEKVGDNTAAPYLLEIFRKDKDREVKAAAAIALGALTDINAVEALTEFLQKKPNEDDEFLRRSSARSIGRIAQIRLTGNNVVNTPQNMLPDKFKVGPIDQSSRLIAEEPQFVAAVKVLENVLNNRNESDDTRREAAFALGSIRSTTSINILRSFQNSPDPYLAEIAKEALIKIN